MKEFKRTKNNPTIGMTNEEVTEYWINQSINKFGDNFDYNEVGVITIKKDPCTVICKKHGKLNTSFERHLDAETGCPKCGREKYLKSKTSTLEKFNKKLDLKYPDRDWEVIGEYIHNKIPVVVKDKYGLLHSMKPSIMLNSSSTPSVNTAINKEEYCIRRFNEVHNFKYQYPNFVYCGTKCYFTAFCPVHGDFKRTPNDHNNGVGCKKCGADRTGDARRSNTQEFIDKSIERWGHNIKIYDKVVYVGAKDKVDIFCELHNEYYSITPNDHLTGYGCPTCGLETGGYSREDYVKQSKGRQSTLYIIKCHEGDESFYKIGITFVGLKTRFSNKNKLPYHYDIIYEHNCDARCVWDLEKEHHKRYKGCKHIPKINFQGYTECFDLSLPIIEIIENLKKL
jgi:predicted  nucleic acid-binding Zn-ribbon protein